MLAIWIGALAPAISQALNSTQRDDTHDICGTRYVKSDLSQPGKPAALAHSEACAYCATHAGSFGLLPVDIQVAIGKLDAPFELAVIDVEPQSGSIDTTALPRAPPALS